MALLLIGCVFLGLRLDLSEALLPHPSNGWVSDRVASEGLSDLCDKSNHIFQNQMYTCDLTKDFFPNSPTYLFEKPNKTHKNGNSEWLFSTLLCI